MTLLLCACGTEEEGVSSTAPPPSCPEGAPLLKARDVVGPDPRGYSLVPVKADEQVKAFIGRLVRGAGTGSAATTRPR